MIFLLIIFSTLFSFNTYAVNSFCEYTGFVTTGGTSLCTDFQAMCTGAASNDLRERREHLSERLNFASQFLTNSGVTITCAAGGCEGAIDRVKAEVLATHNFDLLCFFGDVCGESYLTTFKQYGIITECTNYNSWLNSRNYEDLINSPEFQVWRNAIANYQQQPTQPQRLSPINPYSGTQRIPTEDKTTIRNSY